MPYRLIRTFRSYRPSFLFATLCLLVSAPAFTQEQLEEMTIIGSKVDVPLREVGSAVTVITQDEIQLRGYGTLTDLFRTQVGIAASNNGGAGKSTSVRIRGEEGYRTLMLIDGVELSDASGVQVGPQVQYLVNTNDIARVEILRGPQGFIYGADSGGVISINTLTAEDGLSGQVGLEGGRYNSRTLSAYIAAGNEQGDMFISLNNQDSEGFNSQTTDLNADNDGHRNTTLHTKLGWNINPAWRAQLVVRDIQASSEFDGFFSADAASDDNQTTSKLSLGYQGENISHHIGLSNTDVERVSLSDGVATFSVEGTVQKVEYFANVKINENIKLITGADHKIESSQPRGGDNSERDQTAVFTELQSSFNNQLYLSAGLRFDDNENFGQHTSGRLSGAFVHTIGLTDIKYRTSVGTGFRAPSLSEINTNLFSSFVSQAARDQILQEEKSRGADLGIDVFMNNGATVELTLFKQEIHNAIFYQQGYFQDNGITDSKGVELAASVPVTSYLTLDTNITRNKTTNRDGISRLRRPKWLANVGARFNFIDNKLRVLANIRTSRDAFDTVFVDNASARVPLDNYHVLDISVSYKPDATLEWFGRLENANNADYEEVTTYNTTGSALYVGARFSF